MYSKTVYIAGNMKIKNKLLTILALSTGAAAAIAVINKFVKLHACSKNVLSEPETLCYKWRLGNIYYTKIGTGKPLLLIHDLRASSSSFEWNRLIHSLKNHYTVYSIDLLGCGKSEKPNMIYTNYLYVQLISDFIQNVIGHRTHVIASGESASVPIMACANNSDLFDQIMLVNPLSLLEYSQIPGKTGKYYRLIVEMPIIGTLLYHIALSKRNIEKHLVYFGFFDSHNIKSNYVDCYYESSHLGASPKSLYASVKCNYTKCNITNALKKIDNSIYLIGGAAIDCMEDRLEEYKIYNPAIETVYIPDTKILPQLESPNKLLDIIEAYL